jgi:hypothetical protein
MLLYIDLHIHYQWQCQCEFRCPGRVKSCIYSLQFTVIDPQSNSLTLFEDIQCHSTCSLDILNTPSVPSPSPTSLIQLGATDYREKCLYSAAVSGARAAPSPGTSLYKGNLYSLKYQPAFGGSGFLEGIGGFTQPHPSPPIPSHPLPSHLHPTSIIPRKSS